MSVANILDPVTGQILPAYIPSGAGEFVTNPMAASLDCGGFDLTDCDDITCSNIISKSHDVTDGAGTVQGSFTFGTTTLGTGIQLQGTGANLLVAENIKAGASLIGNVVDTDLVNLPAYDPAGDDTGLTFASVTNELYVRYADGVGLKVTASSGTANLTTTGTVQGSLLNSTGNVTASGNVTATTGYVSTGGLKIKTDTYDLFGRKSLLSGVGTVNCPAISLSDTIIITPAVNRIGSNFVYYTTSISDGTSFTITSRDASNGNVYTADGSTVSFLVVKEA